MESGRSTGLPEPPSADPGDARERAVDAAASLLLAGRREFRLKRNTLVHGRREPLGTGVRDVANSIVRVEPRSEREQ